MADVDTEPAEQTTTAETSAETDVKASAPAEDAQAAAETSAVGTDADAQAVVEPSAWKRLSSLLKHRTPARKRLSSLKSEY